MQREAIGGQTATGFDPREVMMKVAVAAAAMSMMKTAMLRGSHGFLEKHRELFGDIPRRSEVLRPGASVLPV